MRAVIFYLSLLLAGGNAYADNVRTETLGVVLMHGKQGSPAQLQGLADAIAEAGFPTERPDMCWSRARIYDKTYLDCLGDADAAVARLKARGATAIVILGMSLGGNAALAYGARRQGLAGVIALAPAHAVEFLRKNPRIAHSVAQAEAMAAAGEGDRKAMFADVNTGAEFEVDTTANIYLSFFGPTSPAMMPDNAEHLKAPLLVVSGNADSTQRSIPYVFARAPDNPRNQRVTVFADHRGTPAAAREIVLKWLHALAAN
jgi:esterase/lipase